MKSINTNTIVGLAILALLFFGLFFVAKGLFTLLSYAAPVLLILALIFDYNVVINYGKSILKNLRENLPVGIILVLVTIFAYPFVTAYLAGRAFLSKKISSFEQQVNDKREGEYTEYEDVTEPPEILELPPLENRKIKSESERSSAYDNLFDE